MAGAHPHLPESPRRVPDVAARERAFTLIEVIVVLVVVAILFGFIGSVMTTGRTSSGRAGAVSAARVLGDAIDDFRKDHGGRPPVLGHARDWPAPLSEGPQHAFSRQPGVAGGTGRRYLRRGAPDALANSVAAIVGPTATTAGASRWALQYAPSTAGAGGWTITVRDTRGSAPPCSIGGGEIGPLPERVC